MSNVLPSREAMITIGTVAAVTVMVLLIMLEHKFTIRMLLIGAMSALATLPGGIFGELVRKLTYGQWNTFVSDFSLYEGTHYLGRTIYTICVGFLLWQIIMRKHTGTFAKEGRGRFLDVLSVFMLIQIIAGRIGCISNGCCVGKTYYGALSIYNADLGCRVYPAVHTELIISLITLAIVIALYAKRKNAFSAFCIGYSIALFIAECMYDSTGTVKILGLTVVQLLSVAVLVTGIIYSYIFGHSTAEYIKNNKKCGNKLPQKRRKSL